MLFSVDSGESELLVTHVTVLGLVHQAVSEGKQHFSMSIENSEPQSVLKRHSSYDNNSQIV